MTDEEKAVAPHAGAWIETPPSHPAISSSYVAPHAGAWIETRMPSVSLAPAAVAPHAGAWIEICYTKEPVETDGLFPYLLPLISYLLLLTSHLIPHTLHLERRPDEWTYALGVIVSDRLREIVCV